ncbi:hypothetical protein WKW50_25395 [Ochrobactrum sp. GPK 3]|uniref:hypothetical protein n=1 Tax=Brucella sp. 22210 TaxID=3453892 RepID=UPI0031384D11
MDEASSISVSVLWIAIIEDYDAVIRTGKRSDNRLKPRSPGLAKQHKDAACTRLLLVLSLLAAACQSIDTYLRDFFISLATGYLAKSIDAVLPVGQERCHAANRARKIIPRQNDRAQPDRQPGAAVAKVCLIGAGQKRADWIDVRARGVSCLGMRCK